MQSPSCIRLAAVQGPPSEGRLRGEGELAGFLEAAAVSGRASGLPPLARSVELATIDLETFAIREADEPAQSISAFVCFIDYSGESRLVSCRRYERIGDHAYVGAICYSKGGYKRFRCDRIEAVSDATTGEHIGNGDWFRRFALDSEREGVVTWGLTSSRRSYLIAGLNALAFMARCDGEWHALESDVIEEFVCSLWLQKEWEGQPPIPLILAHAERLAPDSSIFFSSLKTYAHSRGSTVILRRAIARLIDADGVIRPEEIDWGLEVDEFFRDYELSQSWLSPSETSSN